MSQLLLDGKTLVREPVAGVCVCVCFFPRESSESLQDLDLNWSSRRIFIINTSCVIERYLNSSWNTVKGLSMVCTSNTAKRHWRTQNPYLIYTFDLQVQNLMNGMSCFLAFQRAKKSQRVNPRFVGYLHQYNVGKQNLKTLTTDYSHFIL